jgi:hypothetical protein
MKDEFTRQAIALDGAGLDQAIEVLGVQAAEFWAVLQVETSGCGFLSDRRPGILYERHIFSERTRRQFDASHPALSNPEPGGYGPDGSHQYDRLKAAIALDRRAALESTSWGIGQVMGFNAKRVGYADVEALVVAMCESEAAQVLAMARFVETGKLTGAMKSHDWTRFAAGYNGSNFRINNYDTRLAAAFESVKRNPPDLDIRTGQLYLTYLGFDPHGVDGMIGKRTRSAMNEFQVESHLPKTEQFDASTLTALRDAVARTS